MADFFVSYNAADKDWAEWIAFVVEEADYDVLIRAWDFRPGTNFVLKMEAAASDRTILVLSPDYLLSEFAAPEWASAFQHDPLGMKQKLLPIMVRQCNPPILLSPIVQVRIFGLSADAARSTLIAGLNRDRAKPSTASAFPGAVPETHKAFPGDEQMTKEPAPRSAVLPSLAAKPTDRDNRRFLKDGFEEICRLFEQNVTAASKQEPRIQIDVDRRTSADFRAELFVDGRHANGCRIWIGGLHSDDSIGFAEGTLLSEGAYNEMFSVERDT